jgi:hypothetical protein
VVAPGGKQLGLVAGIADTTLDQPVVPIARLGDLGDPLGV